MWHRLATDEIVQGPLADAIPEGHVATRAVVIVETIAEDGRGLMWSSSDDITLWDVIGMLTSVLNRVAELDASGWCGDEED